MRAALLHPGVCPALVAALSPLLARAQPAALRPQDELPDPRRTPVVEVIQRVKPAVVSISSDKRVISYSPFFGRQVENDRVVGTGVVIFEDGYIITNNHVVDDATGIRVTFDETDDSHVYEGRVLSQVPEEDLALIKIDGTEPFHTVPLCESDPILGEPVIAIGNAFGHSHTVSTGIVSGLHREVRTPEGLVFSNLIQTDASINRGNSGGPLLNILGELIGINTAMNTVAENIGFAIPVSRVRRVLSDQLLSPSKASSWLGFDVDPASFEVTRVFPGGPAEEVGLLRGDRLRALAGHLLTSEEDYRRVRLSIQPGKEVALTVLRGGGERRLSLMAWNQVDGLLFERLGLTLDVVRFGARFEPYLRVVAVQPDGPAGTLELRTGDLLFTIRKRGWRQKRWFQRPEDLAYLVSGLLPGTELELEVARDEDGDGIFFEIDQVTRETELYEGVLTLR
jgi:serine protease Do